jgi:ribosome maturation factor RimP
MSVSDIEKLVAPLVEQESAELVDLTYAKEGPRWILRVFIDKEGGITLDDCAYFSDRIGALVDSTNAISRSYVLEVSSPGLDRVIKKEKDYERFAGKTVRLRLRMPEQGQRNFKGILRGFRDGKVLVECDGGQKEFELGAIDETRIDSASDVEKEL